MAVAWKVRNCPILLLLSRSLDNVSCGLCPVSDDDMDNTWDNKAQCQCQHFTNDMLSPCWPHQVAITTIYWLLLTLSSMISSSSTLSLKCVKDSGLKMSACTLFSCPWYDDWRLINRLTPSGLRIESGQTRKSLANSCTSIKCCKTCPVADRRPLDNASAWNNVLYFTYCSRQAGRGVVTE